MSAFSVTKRRDAVALLSGMPLAITQNGLQLMLAVASRDELFCESRLQALQAREGQPLQNTRAVSVRDGVAIIPVVGPLIRHADVFTDISGATSYAHLRKDLQVALETPAVRAIVLDVDSPGGEVNGCGELADALYAARGIKRIVSYVGGDGCSAAYWLASATAEVVCAASATLGSIGVRTVMVDDSKWQEQQGRRRIEFVSSQSPHKTMDPANADDRARLGVQLDALAQVFVGAVARNRGVSTSTVLDNFGKGDVFVGEAAVRAGLADRLGSFESVLAGLATAAPQRPTLAVPPAAALPRKQVAQRRPKQDESAGSADQRTIALAAARARKALGTANQVDRDLLDEARREALAKREAAILKPAATTATPRVDVADGGLAQIAAAAERTRRELDRIERHAARNNKSRK